MKLDICHFKSLMNFPQQSCGVSLRSVAQAAPRNFALQRRQSTLPLGGSAPSDPPKTDAIHPPAKLGGILAYFDNINCLQFRESLNNYRRLGSFYIKSGLKL